MTTASTLLAYDPNNIKPGWIAFILVVALCVATFFLWRSMNTQLGKIQVPKAGRESEPADKSEADGDSDEGARPGGETGDEPDPA